MTSQKEKKKKRASSGTGHAAAPKICLRMLLWA
jgi:hypothetical protein